VIPFRPEISACDDCGVCCLIPCLLSGYRDLKRLQAHFGRNMLDEIQVEKTPNNQVQVRIRPVDGKCPFHIDGRCSIHKVKPIGAKEFECWTLSSYRKTYFWSDKDLKRIGFIGVRCESA